MSADSSEHTPRVEQFRQRVTIDMDGDHYPTRHAFRLDAVRCWHNLEDAADDLEVHVSSGQGGLHFVAWFEDDLPFYQQLQIRRANGDDPRRVDMDKQRWLQLGGRFSDVLFQQKGDRETTKERGFSDVYGALDYIKIGRAHV